MSPSKAELIAHELRKAWDAFHNAKHDFQGGFMRGANNRLYYAAFYGASAVMLAEGISVSKHTGVRGFVNKELIKTGKFPIELGDVFNDLFEQRADGDYGSLVDIDPLVLAQQFPLVEDFLRHVENYLHNNNA